MAVAAAEPQVVWHAHPDVWILMGGLALAYVFAVAKLGPKRAPEGEPSVTTRQKAWFFAGLAALYIGSEWPIHDIAEDFLFSVHMVQHTIFTLVAPPMLLLGMPRWMLRALLPAPLMKAGRFLFRPLIALIIFNVVIAVTHWPRLVNASVASEPTHFLLHVVLVGSALIMWWPVVGRLPELPSLGDPGKILYLFAQSIVPTVPASFLTFAEEPLFSSYASFPRLWGISAVTDQMTAGLLMKIGGGLLLWGIIAVIFFRWHMKEERETTESVTWHEFEHELEALDLRRT
ncbi:MAG: cytochrome c oxidase assembly protein [Actinomycetota bacterium]